MGDKSKLKVLMTADTIGGVWHYVVELIKNFIGFPVEFYVATLGALPNEDQRKQFDGLENATLLPSDFRLEWMEQCGEDVEKTKVWLKELCASIQPDLIHLNNFSPAFIESKIPVMTVVHSCVLTWWKSVHGVDAPRAWDGYKQLVGEVLHAADLVVAPSRSMLTAAEAVYGNFGNSRVIYNGRDPLVFGAAKKDSFVLSIGRIWDEAKNIALLAEAAADISWPVVVVGENLHPFTGANTAFQNIYFTGKLSSAEVKEWLEVAPIYVAPAKYEPFGLAILEAALSKCALVTGNIDTMQELWGNASIQVNTNDAGELSATVNRLISDEDLRSEHAARAYKNALKYCAEKMARSYFDTYLELAGNALHKSGNKKETILNLYL